MAEDTHPGSQNAPAAPELGEVRPWRGQFAEHLLAEYLRVAKKRGKQSRRAQTATKYEALDMLEEMGAPPSVLTLFDTMLGGVVREWEADEDARKWVSPAIEYEARALLDGCDVTTAELVDNVFLKLRPNAPSRRSALREVGAVRKKDWYWSFVLTRRDALARAELPSPPIPAIP